MKVSRLLIIFTLTISLIGQNVKEEIYNELYIIEDSEIGYMEFPGGHVIWEKKEEPPDWFGYTAICKKGKVLLFLELQWWNGKNRANPDIARRKRIFINEINLKKYLKLWKKLQKYDVWSLTSKTLEELDLNLSDEELARKFEDMYEVARLEESTYQFFFRVKNEEHRFKVYDIEGLKDKKYLNLLKDIKNSFGIDFNN